MVVSEVVTLLIYVISIAFLPEYFGKSRWNRTRSSFDQVLKIDMPDLSFVLSPRFAWKVAVIVAISAFPLYIIKLIRSRVAPAASSKLL